MDSRSALLAEMGVTLWVTPKRAAAGFSFSSNIEPQSAVNLKQVLRSIEQDPELQQKPARHSVAEDKRSSEELSEPEVKLPSPEVDASHPVIFSVALQQFSEADVLAAKNLSPAESRFLNNLMQSGLGAELNNAETQVLEWPVDRSGLIPNTAEDASQYLSHWLLRYRRSDVPLLLWAQLPAGVTCPDAIMLPVHDELKRSSMLQQSIWKTLRQLKSNP